MHANHPAADEDGRREHRGVGRDGQNAKSILWEWAYRIPRLSIWKSTDTRMIANSSFKRRRPAVAEQRWQRWQRSQRSASGRDRGSVGRGEVFGSLGADFACQSSINASQQVTRCGAEWGPTWRGCGKTCGKGSVWRAWLIGETHENRAGSQIANVSSEVTMECEILILWRGGGEGADAAGRNQAPPERGRGGRTHHTTRGHQHQGTPGGLPEVGVEGWFVVGMSVDGRDCRSPGPSLSRCVAQNLGMHQGGCGH